VAPAFGGGWLQPPSGCRELNRSYSGLAAEQAPPSEAAGSAAIAQIAERVFAMELKEKDHKMTIESLARETQDWRNRFEAAQSKLRLTRGGAEKETPLHAGGFLAESELPLVDRVRRLEQEKAKLCRANADWKSQWDKIEQKHQMAQTKLRSRYEQEAEHRRSAERRAAELEAQLFEAQTLLSTTARDKRAAELNASASRGSASLQAEISMLHEQLKVYEEDFEREREDRILALKAKKDAETTAKQINSQTKRLYQKQIKDRDDTIAHSLQQNEQLLQQLADLTKEKQDLQRKLSAAQQRSSHGRPYQSALSASPSVWLRSHPPETWTCSACTCINCPGRTVCDSCGLINSPERGPYKHGPLLFDNDQQRSDPVSDSGVWLPPAGL